ncbi:MAG TPA: AI-2E family transporter, partial [Longimicrobiales bacterium]|nr:AI-2E family transporter [Longimicrobiales bacterium]
GWLQAQYQALTGESVTSFEDLDARARGRIRDEMATIVGGALPLLNTMLGGLLGIFVIVAAGLFAAVEPGVYVRGAERLMPPRVRGRVERALREVGHTLRWWMVGTAAAMLIIGTLTTVALWLLDMPAFVALGILAGLLQFIPMIGPLLSAVPAVAVALIISPAKVAWVIVVYAGIQFVESNFVTPLVMREAVHLPPALTLLFQALMAVIFGFLGLLLAVPILAAALVLVRTLYVEPMEEAAGSGPPPADGAQIPARSS